uniref:Thymidine phosphorylase n=1 Tax=Arion vulgaris TaxID=1028688 RepID=A0A0B7A8J5_9EUPU
MSTVSYPELISKKRDGNELTDEEIGVFVKGVVTKSMTDSQIGAMLMAIYLKNLSERETSTLTRDMMNSGATLTWPAEWSGCLVDKHSTGGVGDKVSLVLAPALAALNLKVPMISGRGLAHTGGTLDKLESIPGFNASLSHAEIINVLSEVGCFIAGQTEDICPADKRIYSIRDVTSTVSHLGLITSSIVSKKAAENISALVLDVKTGRGAFFEDESKALELARSMVSCSKSLGISTVALLTDMDSPIGNMVGNALEVMESIQCLQGNGPEDLLNLVLDLGSHLLHTSKIVTDVEEGRNRLRSKILDGSALSKFCAMLKGQGVAADVADDICNPQINIWTMLTPSINRTDFYCLIDGYVKRIDAMDIAIVTHKLGGGRNVAGEKINWAVGVELLVDIGDKVIKGEYTQQKISEV